MTITVNVRNTMPAAFQRLRARYPQAEARALNRAVISARTAMVPLMAQDLGVKQGLVKDGVGSFRGLRVRNATAGKLVASLSASLVRIPLYLLGAKASKRGYVTFRGKKLDFAFQATMPNSGHTGIFKRKLPTRKRYKWGQHALPIIELRGASFGHVFIKYMEQGRQAALTSLAKNLQSELKFALSRS